MAECIKGLEHAVEDIKNLMAPMNNLDGKWKFLPPIIYELREPHVRDTPDFRF